MIGAVGLALLLLASASSTPVEVARSEAEANVKTPAGKRYEGVLVSKLEDWLRPALERCVRDEPKEERVSFDALVRVSGEGRAEEALFRPETAVARCVAPEFREATYPRPPQPSWWVKVEVRLK
jgi:hypothetical protein